MQRSVSMNEYKQQCYAKDDAIKRLDDELRDMENELNMARMMQKKGRPEDTERISDLESQLES